LFAFPGEIKDDRNYLDNWASELYIAQDILHNLGRAIEAYEKLLKVNSLKIANPIKNDYAFIIEDCKKYTESLFILVFHLSHEFFMIDKHNRKLAVVDKIKDKIDNDCGLTEEETKILFS
jgi:hypothetical protein